MTPNTSTTKIGGREVREKEKDLITTEETTQPQEPMDDLLPAVIRSEVNFIQFPFFALSWRGLKNKTETEYRIVTERNGEKAELLWRVSANTRYGYPTPFDRRVARAIEALVNDILQEKGYIENPIRFSIYQIAKLMGLNFHPSGQFYQDIKDALTRIVFTGVESRGTFFLKDEKRWLHKVFHLYESAVFKGKEMPDGKIADATYVWLGEEIRRNFNTRHIKPLDYKYLTSLQSDLASRLYELLSLKFYGLPIEKDHLRISYLNLCQTLPITPQKYYSLAKQKLKPAHKELIQTGFLSEVSYQRSRGKKDFNILYYLGERAKKEKRGEFPVSIPLEEQLRFPLIEEQGSREVPQLSPLAQELHSRGISKSDSIKLFQNYPEELIREKLEMFDFLLESRSQLLSKNPAGWLRQAIQEDFYPTEEQLRAKDAYLRMQAEDERKARWIKHRNELIEQDLKDWDKIPLEERIKGFLEFWLAGFELKRLPNPSHQEIEWKEQELINSLPKTEEERRSSLASKYPLNPPEDFI